MISDIKSESISPALNLFKKHIITLKQKIKNIYLEKSGFILMFLNLSKKEITINFSLIFLLFFY